MDPREPRAHRGRARRAGQRLRRSLPLARRRLGDHDMLLLAAGLTFYAGIAVVPLLLVAVFLSGLVLGHDRVHDLARQLADLAPDGLGFSARLVDLVRAGAALSPLAVAAALVPATTYGEGVHRAFDRLAATATPRKGVLGRLKSVALLGTLPLLVAGALAVVAVLPDLLGAAPGSPFLGGYLAFLAAWLGGTVLLAVTYRAFSPVTLGTSALLWGSAGAGSFLAGMSLAWVYVLEAGIDVGQAYGGSDELGAAVLFAIYLFLVQLVCLTGYAWTLALDAAASEGEGCP